MKTPEDWPHKEEAIYRPSVETPTLEIQYAQIKDAMLQYHQTTFLPNNRFMLEACQQFTQTPSSSSTTPRFRLIQWTTASRPLRPRWATKLFYFGVYQPLDSPSTTSTGTSNTFATLSTRDSVLTTSIHANGTQTTSTNSSGATRRLSSTTGRSPSRTIQIFILQGCHASHGIS